jgi:hypothetical protein
MRQALTAAALVMLALPGAASAHAKPKTVHCKNGYARETRNVKERRHGKTIRLRVPVCVKRKASKTIPKMPPSSPAPQRTIKLHAHLDPSFTRDPTDPFKVTYAYSASATSETLSDGVALDAPVEPAPLPEGVLQLFSDGNLACAINVGGSTTGGECPIEYSKLGQHTVTTIYASGATSATETQVENVEAIKGTISLSVSYVPLEHSRLEPEESGCKWEEWAHGGAGGSTIGCERWILGTLNVRAGATTTEGISLPGAPSISLDAPTCHWTVGTQACSETGTGSTYTLWATSITHEWNENTETHYERSIAEVGILEGEETLPPISAWGPIHGASLSLPTLAAGGYSATGIYSSGGYMVPTETGAFKALPQITE